MYAQVILVVGVLIVFAWVAQWLINRYKGDNELLRKLVHVCHGIGIAILAFILPTAVLVGIEAVFLASMFIARYLLEHFSFIPWIKYFGKVYRVGRVSYGEFFYPLSVIIVLLIANSKWEAVAAILILALADTAAAIVGKRFGKSTTYPVLGQKKSLIGSAAFFVTTYAILSIFILISDSNIASEVSFAQLLFISLAITVTENLSVYGSDNLWVPIVAVVLLNRL